MKTLSSLILCGSLLVSFGAMAGPAVPAAQPVPGAGPEKLNSAQISIIRQVLVERYKSNIAILQSGLSCMEKVTTQDAMQGCMNAQTQAAMADQKKSQAITAKMQKDMAAAAGKK